MLKDNDVDILYHLRKVNVVADTLSQKLMGNLRHVKNNKLEMAKDLYMLANLSVWLLDIGGRGATIQNATEFSLVAEVNARQFGNPTLVKIRKRIPIQKRQVFEISEDEVLRYQDRLCVPDVGDS